MFSNLWTGQEARRKIERCNMLLINNLYGKLRLARALQVQAT